MSSIDCALSLSEKRKAAGKLGGLATVAKHGRRHMSSIGKMGADALWQRYQLKPYQLNKFALVDRETGLVVAVRS